MQFILTGFTQDAGFRVFAFEGIETDRTRSRHVVRADLGMIRQFGIRVQELPLLCRGVLERRNQAEEQRMFTYTEADMRLHANVCAVQAAAQKRKPPRRPPAENLGAAWRRPQP